MPHVDQVCDEYEKTNEAARGGMSESHKNFSIREHLENTVTWSQIQYKPHGIL